MNFLFNKLNKRTILPAAVAACFSQAAAGADSAPLPIAADNPRMSAASRQGDVKQSGEQLLKSIESISILIEKSSVAKQVENSNQPDAHKLRGDARELLHQAEESNRAGDSATTIHLLGEAARAMYSAVHLTDRVNKKEKQDFDARMTSVEALLAAQRRIAIEKNKGALETDTGNKIEAMMHDAGTLVAAGQIVRGRKLLDQAYAMVKTSIEGLRHGETLVRSLNFASKEEEYRYEIDRNDTHKMLVNLLLEERQSNPGLDVIVRKHMEKAGRLRAAAEEYEGRKDFAAGIKQLEESTHEMVHAIRAAGVYIPD